MKYTVIPESTFQQLQINAGVILTDFNPTDGTVDDADILGATTGGVTFQATPEFSDFGEDIDNCPKNMLELKRLTSWEVTASGTFISVNDELVAKLAAAADVSGNKITPRNDLKTSDFGDIWIVGDYGAKDGGFVAVHILNALSTGGFQMTTQDEGKGQFAFVFTGHYSMNAQTVVPFEVYVSAKE